jgi:hypothetical protein
MGQSMGYTPGPWQWLNYFDGRKLLMGPNNAVIHCPHEPLTIGAADAALIAAAPRLLEVLRAIVDQWEQTGDVGVAEFAAGRDAVTQATGN